MVNEPRTPQTPGQMMLPGSNFNNQFDTQAMAAVTMNGPGRNFQPTYVMSYYSTKERVNQRLLEKFDNPRQIRALTEQLLDYIPDEDRRRELYDLIDILDEEWRAKRVEVLKAERKSYTKETLPDDEKIESMQRACSTVRYKIQLEINHAHGLVKERAIGCAFPFYSEGRFMFPIKEVPQDGLWVRADTLPVGTDISKCTKVDMKMYTILMRTKIGKAGTVPTFDPIQDDARQNGDEDDFEDLDNPKPQKDEQEYNEKGDPVDPDPEPEPQDEGEPELSEPREPDQEEP